MNEKKTLLQKSWFVTIISLVITVLIMCGVGYFVYARYYKSANVLMSMESYGGNCGDKQCPPMNIVIYETGEIHHFREPNVRHLDIASTQALKDAIMHADFQRMHKFATPGRCENYSDGTDYIIKFYSNGNTETFNTCGHSIPDGQLKDTFMALQNSDYTKIVQ